jgi:hypothetical protein
LAGLASLPFACASQTSSSEGGDINATASRESAPPLGSSASFAVLAGTTVTSTGPTTIEGDLGVDPGLAITGFPPGIVSGGTVHTGDAVALQAQTDVTAAYDVLAGEPCSADLTGTDLGGLTLVPGVYCFSSSAQLTGALVLDAQGDAGAVFVFKMVSTLTTASDASVRVINGGGECGVFWQVGSSAVLGTGTAFSGSIFALTSISLATGAQVSGRALARNGAVTMDGNTVSVGSCVIAPTTDAGMADAAPIDSGNAAPEAGGIDAALIDGGIVPPEAGAVDACVEDAGPEQVDTGASEDAGVDACCEGTTCGSICTDLSTDPLNCGACGDACMGTETCTAGVCSACIESDQ